MLIVTLHHTITQVNSNQSAAELCPSGFGSWTLIEQRDYVDENSDQLSCYCNQFDSFEQSADKLCQHYLERNIASQVRTALIFGDLFECFFKRAASSSVVRRYCCAPVQELKWIVNPLVR